MPNLMQNLGAKIGAEFKAHRLRIENVESGKVDKVAGKQLSTEDYTSLEKSKLAGIESGAQVNTVNSVSGKTGAVTLTKSDVGLSNVDNTSDANKPISNAVQTALNLKADEATTLGGYGITDAYTKTEVGTITEFTTALE